MPRSFHYADGGFRCGEEKPQGYADSACATGITLLLNVSNRQAKARATS
jgi:hypothetical protein